MLEGISELDYKKVVDDYKSKPDFQTDAIKSIEGKDGKVFLSGRLYEEAISKKVADGIEEVKTNLKKTVQGHKEKEAREAIKSITSIRWDEDEDLNTYTQRAISEYSQMQMKSTGKTDEAHVKGLTDQIEILKEKANTAESKLKEKDDQIFNSKIDSLMSKAEGDLNLDYDDYTKQSVLKNLREEYKNAFEIQNNEGTLKIVNKATGAELMSGSDPVQLNDSYSQFIKDNSNIKFKASDSTLPDSSGEMVDLELNMSKAKEEINALGLYDHVVESAEIRKKYGVSTDKDKEVFVDLFDSLS